MQQKEIIGFADLAAEGRIKKENFLDQINQLIDWRPIQNIVHKHYSKGKSHTGSPAYEGILLFKICLLQPAPCKTHLCEIFFSKAKPKGSAKLNGFCKGLIT